VVLSTYPHDKTPSILKQFLLTAKYNGGWFYHLKIHYSHLYRQLSIYNFLLNSGCFWKKYSHCEMTAMKDVALQLMRVFFLISLPTGNDKGLLPDLSLVYDIFFKKDMLLL
jgi:hypothetical protein